MEDQITIRLPRSLSRALKERATRLQRKPSEVVRMAVVEFLQIPAAPLEQPAERIRDLIGSLQSGVPDLASKHRAHILMKVRRGK
jgi:hypothetical protein